MDIEIIGTESLGVRGLCCSVRTGSKRILFDPGIALGFHRYGWEIVGSGFTSSQIIEEVTEIKMDEIKVNKRSKRISDIIKLYIKFLKSFTDLLNKEIADLHKIVSPTVTNVLSGRYKENNFMIKSSMKIDKNVKL